MNTLHTIVEIKQVEPLRITCLWNTGEVRVNDFTSYLQGKNERLHGLGDATAFQAAQVVDGTLHWPSILVSGLFKGSMTMQPLALDPEVLYNTSQPVGTVLRTVMSYQLRQARLTAGLTQTQLAALSGTTKEYISRIESGKADFQVSTFDRILQQGLGKHASILVG